MKHFFTFHRVLRTVSLSAFLLFPLDVFMRGSSPADALVLSAWSALLLLLLYPPSHVRTREAVLAMALSWALFIFLRIAAAPDPVCLLCASVLLVSYMVRRCLWRYAEVPPLFQVSAVWPGVTDSLWMLHCCVFVFFALPVSLFSGHGALTWALAVVLLIFYCLQYYRVYTRSTVFLGKKKENLIKSGQRGSGYRMPVQYVDSESRSAVLFNDVVRVMETKKPYLSDSFSADELARLVKTNRLYLSKCINFHSGRNFNQLVNYYRVKYAAELIRKDSSLKMLEVSQMSGFHTVVSFNMAFKLNEHLTPGEYARSLKTLTK